MPQITTSASAAAPPIHPTRRNILTTGALGAAAVLAALPQGAKSIAHPIVTADASPAPAAPYRWNNVAIHGGGFVTGLLFHPTQAGLLYARTDVGGAYRMDPGSNRWIPITDWIGGPDWNLSGISGFAVDPAAPNRIYLAAGMYTQAWADNGAILHSTDRGRTFTRSNLPIKLGGNEQGRFNGERLAVDPRDPSVLFLGTPGDGLWRSADHAATWQKVRSFPTLRDTAGVGVIFIAFDSLNGGNGPPTPIIYVGVSTLGGGVYRSTDAGRTWRALPGQPRGLRPNHAARAADGALYISYGKQAGPNSMTDGAVWKFHREHWTNITPLAPADDRRTFGYGAVAVDAQHVGTVMTSTFCRWNGGDIIFRSADAGAHWTAIHPGHHGAWSAGQTKWVKFHSPEPQATNWIGSLQIDPHNRRRVVYTTGWGVFACNDMTDLDSGGTTRWKFFCEGLEETVVTALISPPAGAHLLSAVGDIDGFKHDNLRMSPLAGMFNPTCGSNTGLDFAEQQPSFIVRTFSGKKCNGAFSVDGGTTWTFFEGAPPGAAAGTMAVAADGSAMVWTPAGQAPHHSRDRGRSWGVCDGLERGWAVIADRARPAQFFAFNAHLGRIAVSRDHGKQFGVTRFALPKAHAQLCSTPRHTGDLWLASPHGLYHMTDGMRHPMRLATVHSARHVAFGKAARGRNYPALYVVGSATAGLAAKDSRTATYGFFRSDDAGATWVRINDFNHQFFTINAVAGDPRLFGRVYIGTSGRGIVYGDPAI